MKVPHSVSPGGPGEPEGPGKNTGDVKIFSLVICTGMSALFDSSAIFEKTQNNKDDNENKKKKWLK